MAVLAPGAGARMRTSTFLIACIIAVMPAAAATAHVPLEDCPMAGRPWSLDSPLFDILDNPGAKAIIDREAPHAFDALPPIVSKRTTPSLAVILTLRIAAAFAKFTPAQVNAIGRALAVLPVTAADDARRCARYDDTPPPRLPRKIGRPAILVFEHSTGFRDAPSVDAATAALRKMAAEECWHLVFSDKPGIFNPRDLARFDAVVWNNVSGDVLTFGQRAAFENYIARGGGYAGFHGSAGDPLTFWDWYVDTLVGARFVDHPMSPQFQQGTIVVDDPKSPITQGPSSGWTMTEEWYSFEASPRKSGAHVLLTLDEASYTPGNLRMGDHPIAWTRCVGKGRSFYSAIGHLPGSYTQPSAERLLRRGIAWAARLTSDPAAAC